MPPPCSDTIESILFLVVATSWKNSLVSESVTIDWRISGGSAPSPVFSWDASALRMLRRLLWGVGTNSPTLAPAPSSVFRTSQVYLESDSQIYLGVLPLPPSLLGEVTAP